MQNIGSIQKIEIVNQKDVDSISRPDSNGEITIALNQDKDWNDFYFTNYTASFIETEKESNSGSYFEQSVKCESPKISSVNNAKLDSYKNRPLILKVTDGNGVQYLIGNKNIPVRMRLKLIRPAEPSGYNGYEITFYSSNSRKSPIIKPD